MTDPRALVLVSCFWPSQSDVPSLGIRAPLPTRATAAVKELAGAAVVEMMVAVAN